MKNVDDEKYLKHKKRREKQRANKRLGKFNNNLNGEGYSDPTACVAIANADRQAKRKRCN